jgi:hypothetical protein
MGDKKRREYISRVKAYWVYSGITITGILLMGVGFLLLVGLAGYSDMELDFIKHFNITPMTGINYLIKSIKYLMLTVIGYGVYRFGTYGKFVNGKWLNRFKQIK